MIGAQRLFSLAVLGSPPRSTFTFFQCSEGKTDTILTGNESSSSVLVLTSVMLECVVH